VILGENFTIDVGPALALVLIQSVNLGVNALAAYNARRAARIAQDGMAPRADPVGSTNVLTASEPPIHKE